MMATLAARPEAITFDPRQTMLIVVDMRNTYTTPGGYLDLAGFGVSATRPVVANIQTAVVAAQTTGILIIWFQSDRDEQYIKADGPGSPNYHKLNALKIMRNQPLLQGKLLAKGSWDYRLVGKLIPQPDDIVLSRPHYSGFFNTPLDSILRNRGIRHLVFTDIATSVCTEPTLRNGFFLEYFGVVLKDATHQAGSEFAQKAVLFNIEIFFGWVSDTETFCDVFSSISFARIA